VLRLVSLAASSLLPTPDQAAPGAELDDEPASEQKAGVAQNSSGHRFAQRAPDGLYG
jgi:hypothetical protein